MDRDKSCLLDIVRFCETILRLTAGMTDEKFVNDERTQLAILYEITVVGEAVQRLSPEFRSSHPQIEWKKIAGMRDQIIHSYENVDLRMVWQVVQKKIPELVAYINEKCPVA